MDFIVNEKNEAPSRYSRNMSVDVFAKPSTAFSPRTVSEVAPRPKKPRKLRPKLKS